MSKLKCTPGPWEYETVFFSEISEKAFNVGPKGELDDYRVCMIRDEGGIGTDPEDNAKLIVEAGTVYDETGMTPWELVEANAEIMDVLMLLFGHSALYCNTPGLSSSGNVRAAVEAVIDKFKR